MFGSKKNTGEKSAALLGVPSPATEALILICEKCGKKLVAEGEENPSRLIQQRLKEEIKSRGEKGKVRAVVTSCLDICPKDEIAVGFIREYENQFFTLKGDVESSAHLILSKKDE